MVDALNRSFNSPPNSRSSSGSDGGAMSIADALNQSFNGSNSSRSSPATPPRSQEYVDAMMVDQSSTSSGSAPGTPSRYSSNVEDQCPSSSRSSPAAPTRSNVNDGAATIPVDQSFGDSSDSGSSPVLPSQEISSRDLLLHLQAEVAELKRINNARTEEELIWTKEQLKEVTKERDQLKLAQSLSNRVGVDINVRMVPEESGQLLEGFRYRSSHTKYTRSMNRPHHYPYPLPSPPYYRNTAPGYPNNRGSPKYGGLRSYERQSQTSNRLNNRHEWSYDRVPTSPGSSRGYYRSTVVTVPNNIPLSPERSRYSTRKPIPDAAAILPRNPREDHGNKGPELEPVGGGSESPKEGESADWEDTYGMEEEERPRSQDVLKRFAKPLPTPTEEDFPSDVPKKP
ncbi:hypothetical protein C8J56DRAFT_259905 [Mycena floridula]|nr:hypothetical protein C8J56DRAFT_259905 [Mycena floridula]